MTLSVRLEWSLAKDNSPKLISSPIRGLEERPKNSDVGHRSDLNSEVT